MSTRDLESLLDAVLDGVVLVDAGGDVEDLNAEACRILATSTEAARGRPVEDVLGADHSIAKLVRAVSADGRPAIEREHRMGHRDGEGPVVDVEVSPLMQGEAVDGVVLLLRDCTIHDSLRQLVSQRESLSAFGRIAAGIAHEVKNPLGGIRGAAEILAARAGDAKARDAAELIVREVDRIAHLVDDFMVFGRGEDLECAPANIHRVLDDVVELVALDPLGEGLEVEREFDPSIPELWADPGRLTQVFLNLARNAVQAMADPADGSTAAGAARRLTITTRMTLDHRLSAPEGASVPTLLVEIADAGPGIDPAVREKLGTPFFTTRPGGTGLGLAVARHWVSRHGGALRIDGAPGRGTKVTVSLPLRREA